MTPQLIKIRADVEMKCFELDGVLHIKEAMRKAQAVGNEDCPVKKSLVCPPLYVLNTQTLDKEKGIEILEKAISACTEQIERHNGKLIVKTAPRAVGGTITAPRAMAPSGRGRRRGAAARGGLGGSRVVASGPSTHSSRPSPSSCVPPDAGRQSIPAPLPSDGSVRNSRPSSPSQMSANPTNPIRVKKIRVRKILKSMIQPDGFAWRHVDNTIKGAYLEEFKTNKQEMVEENEKLATTAVEGSERNSPSMKKTKKKKKKSSMKKTNVLKEGEIAGGDSDSAAAKAVAALPTRHPLENSWTFWLDNPFAKSEQAAWGSSIRPVFTFSSVEDFWRVYNSVRHPSKLAVGADFHCFKEKIEPKWEDPVCASGRKWTVTFSRGKSDTCWLYTLFALIEEQFDYCDEICGAVVSVQARQEKIALWTKNAANEAAQLSIGRQWKEFLHYNYQIGFIVHADANRLDRGAKNRYTV